MGGCNSKKFFFVEFARSVLRGLGRNSVEGLYLVERLMLVE